MDDDCIGVDHRGFLSTGIPHFYSNRSFFLFFRNYIFQLFGMLQPCHLVVFYYHKCSCPFKVGQHLHISVTVRLAHISSFLFLYNKCSMNSYGVLLLFIADSER